jgi:hypothetical protein
MSLMIRYADELIGRHRMMVRRMVPILAALLLADLILFVCKSPLTPWITVFIPLAVGGQVIRFFRSIGRRVTCPHCKSERDMVPVCRKGVLSLTCKVCANEFETDCAFNYSGSAPARRGPSKEGRAEKRGKP